MAARSTLSNLSDARKKLHDQAHGHLASLLAWTSTCDDAVRAFEPALWRRLCLLALVLYQLFLFEREARLAASLTGPRAFVARTLHTLFGTLTFGRIYLRLPEGGGFFPLDQQVGLHPDKVSPFLAGVGTRLATKMSFDGARDVLGWFLPVPLPTSTLQKAVLGLGAFAHEFLDHLAPPDDDGEVAVAMVDGKCIPTATEAELHQRRQPRQTKPRAASPRHRRRRERVGRESRPRRQPGDKAKNGRQVVLVAVYTLKRQGTLLLGPLNKRVFCVVGPKELGFLWLRGELERRGFGPKSGKVVQLVCDGDTDLQELADKHLPRAKRTLDLYHALEYVAEAGHVLFPKDNAEFQRWFQQAKGKILEGKVSEVLQELRTFQETIPRTGPGTKQKRETLARVQKYLEKRASMMNYGELQERDLEIGSGAVEGAVRYLVGLRFDHGGMRWLRERANPLLQLRCIEENGEWEKFLCWVLDGPGAKLASSAPMLQSKAPPLPTVPKVESPLKKAA